ncbi:MAG: hypothetical protein ABSD31_06780 [Candidatus Binataceae bacterium]|jgi:hypothetical protein
MDLLTVIGFAVFGLVLTMVWLTIMLVALMIAVWIVAELFSLVTGTSSGSESSHSPG